VDPNATLTVFGGYAFSPGCGGHVPIAVGQAPYGRMLPGTRSLRL
jgi:hypothetical protein